MPAPRTTARVPVMLIASGASETLPRLPAFQLAACLPNSGFTRNQLCDRRPVLSVATGLCSEGVKAHQYLCDYLCLSVCQDRFSIETRVWCALPTRTHQGSSVRFCMSRRKDVVAVHYLIDLATMSQCLLNQAHVVVLHTVAVREVGV